MLSVETMHHTPHLYVCSVCRRWDVNKAISIWWRRYYKVIQQNNVWWWWYITLLLHEKLCFASRENTRHEVTYGVSVWRCGRCFATAGIRHIMPWQIKMSLPTFSTYPWMKKQTFSSFWRNHLIVREISINLFVILGAEMMKIGQPSGKFIVSWVVRTLPFALKWLTERYQLTLKHIRMHSNTLFRKGKIRFR